MSSSVIRRLCSLPALLEYSEKSEKSESSTLAIQTTGSELSSLCDKGVAAQQEEEKLISSSLIGDLRELVPSRKTREGHVSLGGEWFWKTYRHSLYGDEVVVDLSGTGVNLAEDTLETQRALRRKMLEEGSKVPLALHHGSSKLEVMCSIALSVALHVVRQPLLEANEGPQALILCATKGQCDEFSFILNRLCSSLHLIVHNLFEPYPSIPEGKRAEIVVGTPTLWESVSPPPARRGNLEDLISYMFDELSAPTYNSTRWRPYKPSHLAQLVIFDLDLQLSFGFGPLLGQVLSREGAPSRPNALPVGVQLYVVSNTRTPFCADHTSLGELRHYLKTSKLFGHAVAEIALHPRLSPAAPADTDGDHTSRKRERASSPTPLRHGLIFRNAISLSRVLLDGSTVRELMDGVLREATQFLGQYNVSTDAGEQGDAVLSPGDVLQCRTACLCGPEKEEDAHVHEVCLLVLFDEEECTRRLGPDIVSRVTVLLQHLEDSFNGRLYDNSIISCHRVGRGTPSSLRPVEKETPWTTLLHQCVPVDCPVACYTLCQVDSATPTEASEDLKEATRLVHQRNPTAGEMTRVEVGDATFLPLHLRSSLAAPSAFTTVVLRRVGYELDGFLRGMPPPLLSYLEECVQYGRVLSYYCYVEPTNPRGKTDESLSSDDDEVIPAVTLFLEFESPTAAVEAARLLQYRFTQDSPNRWATVKLFRTSVYHTGVCEEERKREEKNSHDVGSGEDSEDDFFSAFSWLAE